MREFSIRRNFTVLVLLCWILPVATLLIAFNNYAASGAQRQFETTLSSSVGSAAYLSQHALRLAVIASRDASYDPSIRNAHAENLKNPNPEQFYDRVIEYLNKRYTYDDALTAAIVFYRDDPDNLFAISNSLSESVYAVSSEYRAFAHSEVKAAAETLDTYIGFVTVGKKCYMVRNIVDTATYERIATIVLLINSQNAFGAFSEIADGAAIYLNGTPMHLGTKELSLPERTGLVNGIPVIKYRGDTVRVEGRETLDDVDLLYVLETDKRKALGGLTSFLMVFYALMFALFPLLAVLIYVFNRNIVRPISLLGYAAERIKNGDLGYVVDDHLHTREFEHLRDAFNQMSTRLKRQFERIYSEELALRDARMMALQSQINPHFLNNTLEIINWEARLGDNEKVSEMIEALSTLLDASLDRTKSHVIPLSQEMTYIDAYLHIIRERYGRRLVVVKQIDSALLDRPVPRLILQPVLENAVEHGVAPLKHGEIYIRAFVSVGGDLVLQLENNAPLTEGDHTNIRKLLEDDAPDNAPGRLGIRNVNMRLKILYGQKGKFSLRDSKIGTLAEITIPLLKESV